MVDSNIKSLLGHSSRTTAIVAVDTDGLIFARDEIGDEYRFNSATNQNAVATLAQLRTITGVPGQVSLVAAGYVQGDEAGGLFHWSNAVTADDGGTVINAGGFGVSAAGWRRTYSGPMDIRWFGADATGIADSTQAVQRCLAAATSSDIAAGKAVAPRGLYLLSDTIVFPSHCELRGSPGGRELPLVDVGPDSGTIFKWTGSTSLPIFKLMGVRYVNISDFTINGDSKAGSVGILLDSPASNNATHNIRLSNFGIYNCAEGIRIGSDSPPAINNAYEIDKFEIVQFHIGSVISGSTGIVIASGNAGSDSVIHYGAIQLCHIGIDIVNSAYLRIDHVSCGSLGNAPAPLQANPVAFRVVTGSQILIEQCQSENSYTGGLFLKAPSNSYGSSNKPLVLLDCVINEDISIEHPITVVSIGNSGPTGASGVGTIANQETDLTSIGDTFNDGAGWTWSGANPKVKQLTGKGFLGRDAAPSATLPYSPPLKITTGGIVDLNLGVNAAGSVAWLQAQSNAADATYYALQLNPLGGTVNVGPGGFDNIVTTGYIGIDTPRASAGDIRLAHGFSAQYRNSTNGADRNLANVGTLATNSLQLGDTSAENNTYICSGSGFNVIVRIASSNYLTIGATQIGTLIPAIAWDESVSAPTLRHNDRTTDAAPQDFTVDMQAPFTSATGANRNPGSFIVAAGAPTNSGTGEAKIQLNRSGNHQASMGKLASSSTVGMWLGAITPDNGNYCVAGDGSAVHVNGVSTINLEVGSSLKLQIDGNATVAWYEGISGPALRQTTRTTDAATNPLTIQAQSAYASATGANQNGGDLFLQSGAKVSAGTDGFVYIKCGSTQVGVFDPTASLTLGSSVATTMDLVWDKAVVAPTVSQNAKTTDVATQNLTIKAQKAYTSATGTNRNGAHLVLKGGQKAAGGVDGSAKLQDGAGNTVVEAGDGGKLALFGGTPGAKATITGALSSVTDANAKNVLTSIIAALTAITAATDGTS
jgi:hypothetical protein